MHTAGRMMDVMEEEEGEACCFPCLFFGIAMITSMCSAVFYFVEVDRLGDEVNGFEKANPLHMSALVAAAFTCFGVVPFIPCIRMMVVDEFEEDELKSRCKTAIVSVFSLLIFVFGIVVFVERDSRWAIFAIVYSSFAVCIGSVALCTYMLLQYVFDVQEDESLMGVMFRSLRNCCCKCCCKCKKKAILGGEASSPVTPSSSSSSSCSFSASPSVSSPSTAATSSDSNQPVAKGYWADTTTEPQQVPSKCLV